MSAKKPKRSHPPSSPATPTTNEAAMASAAPAPESVAWIDSADPRKRQIGKIILVAVWIYVGALWLLALDQWFHWGIFGPKTPPLP